MRQSLPKPLQVTYTPSIERITYKMGNVEIIMSGSEQDARDVADSIGRVLITNLRKGEYGGRSQSTSS